MISNVFCYLRAAREVGPYGQPITLIFIVGGDVPGAPPYRLKRNNLKNHNRAKS